MSYSDSLLPVIRQVRKIVLPSYGNIAVTAFKDASFASAVTEKDVAVEAFLRTGFAKLYPDISFVGEENGGDRSKERFFLVDPIDATGNFVRGLPFCTTMVALIEKGEVIFSAIYDFVTDTMYSAEKGKGAKKNGAPITVSNRTLQKATLGWETHLSVPAHMATVAKLEAQCCLFKVTASGYEFAMIAEGRLDGRVTFDPYGKDYDFAPCALLVKEAGGVVANIGKTTYDYRNVNFIATNPVIFKELTEGADALFPIL